MAKAEDNETGPGAGTDKVRLSGEYRFKVDGKGRMSLPAKFRKAMGNELVVVRELEDECVYVFQPEGYEEYIDELFDVRFGGFDQTSRKHNTLMRKLKRRAKLVDVDSSGRIMLPADVRESTRIDGEAVVLGNTGRFEIWNPADYDEVVGEDEECSLSEFKTE